MNDRPLNEALIDSQGVESLGGEKLKLKTAIIAVSISAIVVISALVINFEISDSSGGTTNITPNTNSTSANQPFETLIGNLSNPHPYYNSSYGYVTPNLWGLYYGSGNDVMSLYDNGSIHVNVGFSNLIPGGASVLGYSSEHLIYNIPLSISTAIKENLSSYVSFETEAAGSGVTRDMTYDLFLGQNGTLEYEIMIVLLPSSRYNTPIISTFSTPTTANGTVLNISYILHSGTSFSGNFPAYVFVPSIRENANASYTINIASFLSFLEDKNLIPFSVSIMRSGIGSEFSSLTTTCDYSFWMYTYFILDGIKYQVIQPPPSLEAK